VVALAGAKRAGSIGPVPAPETRDGPGGGAGPEMDAPEMDAPEMDGRRWTPGDGRAGGASEPAVVEEPGAEGF